MSVKRVRLELDVVTYNVLCPQLCGLKDYPECTAEALDADARQQRVWCKLESHIVKRRIVCLQELSRTWYAELLPLLLANRYMIVSAHYGFEGNDFMGVAILYPSDKYDLVEADLPRVAERAKWPPAPPNAAPDTPQRGAMELAKSRQNVMVLLRLLCRTSNAEFVIATYHMPCMYDRPEVMQLHTAAAVTQAQDFADGDPLVLAGDFNFAPDSHSYMIVTRTKCVRADERTTLSAHPYLHKKHLRTHGKMRSAYAAVHKAEPPFTHYSYTTWRGPNRFSGTIDYIFFSEHFSHVAVNKLPDSTAEFATPLPTVEEPSDHLELHARIWAKKIE